MSANPRFVRSDGSDILVIDNSVRAICPKELKRLRAETDPGSSSTPSSDAGGSTPRSDHDQDLATSEPDLATPPYKAMGGRARGGPPPMSPWERPLWDNARRRRGLTVRRRESVRRCSWVAADRPSTRVNDAPPRFVFVSTADRPLDAD